MKKVVLLFSAVVLFAGLTFAQTQEKDKAAKPAAKTETVTKDQKGGCDKKTKEACMHAKEGKGCCAKSKEAAKPAPTPEKK